MNLLLVIYSEILNLLLFQKLSTEDGVPYEPNEGPDWILIVVAVAVLGVLVFVLLRVFRGLQQSREKEDNKEVSDSSQTPEK